MEVWEGGGEGKQKQTQPQHSVIEAKKRKEEKPDQTQDKCHGKGK